MDKNQAHIRLALFISLLVLALLVYFVGLHKEENEDRVEIEEAQIVALTIDRNTFWTLIADTPEEQRRGLSGRPSLEQNQGMLFLFDRSLIRNFWMKDMLFPIDIIWIDENMRITGYKENALPESFPETFSSEVPVKYVFEVNAFETKRRGIEIGDQVEFVYE